MAITCDPVKRAAALRDRQLDFHDADQLFAGRHGTVIDDRFDYGETRLISAGWIEGRMVITVWTPRGDDRHIISMRHCHAKEEREWRSEIEKQV